MSYLSSLRLRCECTKDLCCDLFFLQWWWILSQNLPEGALSELMYTDDLVLTSETIDGLKNKFLKWKEVFESKCLKVNLGKTKVMVWGDITNDCMSKSKVDPCGVCSLRVKANSVLCLQCGKWNHGICAGVISVTPMFSRHFEC